MKNLQKGSTSILLLGVFVLIVLGIGVYLYATRNEQNISERFDGQELNQPDKTNKPQSVKYSNISYKYSFYHTEPPFSVLACNDSLQGTKLLKSDGTEDFVIIYNTYSTSTSSLPTCKQSVDWYKVDAHQASVMAVKESDESWKERVIEFQKISNNTVKVIESPANGLLENLYRKQIVIGTHQKMINGKNVEVADTDVQIISRHNGISYIIRTDALGRTAVFGLLNTLTYNIE
ncbi:MAG: hypothetical protein AAB381_03005 [Patescibacteria group bacterium]